MCIEIIQEPYRFGKHFRSIPIAKMKNFLEKNTVHF